jgi:hypothetical protein
MCRPYLIGDDPNLAPRTLLYGNTCIILIIDIAAVASEPDYISTLVRISKTRAGGKRKKSAALAALCRMYL